MARLPSTPDEFQKHFSKNKISLMASSPPGQSIQRYFFYAQQVCHIPSCNKMLPLSI